MGSERTRAMTSTVEFISLVLATALLVAAGIVQAIFSPALLVTLTQDDKFEMQCNRLREFLFSVADSLVIVLIHQNMSIIYITSFIPHGEISEIEN